MLKGILFAVALAAMSNAWAGPYDPIVTMAWVGESVPGQKTATLQVTLTSIKPVELNSVTSPVAESIEIQSLMKVKGTLKVQIMKNFPLQDHRTITFGSHGLFLMMTGIKEPLKLGDHIPITLTFTFADRHTKVISTEAEVRKMDLSYKHYGPNEVYDQH